MDTTYLVTGAAGHLGGTVVRKLLERGERVRAILLPGEKHVPEGISDVIYADVRDSASLEPAFAHTDDERLIVIHTAGIVSIATKYDQRIFDVNVNGTRNIVDLCLAHKVAKFIHVSSVHAIAEKAGGEEVGESMHFDPLDVVGLYAKTKAEATAIVLAAVSRGLPAVVVHPSGITGPYDYGSGHMTTLVIDYYKGRLTSGMLGGYDFVDVRDVADGILAACSSQGRIGECYILSNRYYSLREILLMLHKITGKRKITRFLPLWFVRLTAPLAELDYKILRQKPLYTTYSIYTVSSNAHFTHAKASSELGYAPRDMYDSLRDTVTWLQEQGRL